jgi:hypothetical protein
MSSNNAINAPLPFTVGDGGTGNTTFTAYSVLCAGTTATGTFQNVSGLGASGQVLTSNGASALPTWQAAGSGSGANIQQFTKTGIVGTSTGQTLLFTVPSGGSFYLMVPTYVILTSSSGIVAGHFMTFTVGTTSGSYVDVIQNSVNISSSDLTASNDYVPIITTSDTTGPGVTPVPTGTGIYINITAGQDATTYVFTLVMLGLIF